MKNLHRKLCNRIMNRRGRLVVDGAITKEHLSGDPVAIDYHRIGLENIDSLRIGRVRFDLSPK